MEERDRDSEATGDAQETRFLPPEPAGPEPDLGDRPAPEPPQPSPPTQTYGYPPPPPGAPGQPPPGYGPPPPAHGQPPPGYGQPPPGYGQPPPGYGQPPPGHGQPPGYGYQPPPWGYSQPPVPDNGQAVAGFVFSLVGLGLLVISFGLSTIVSLGCAITGIVCSRNGKRKFDAGETPKHRGLAQAGFIIGWVGVGLSVLAIVGWVLAIVLEASNDSSIFDESQTVRAVWQAVGR